MSTELDELFSELTTHLNKHSLKVDEIDSFFDGLAYRLEVFDATRKEMNRLVSNEFNVFCYIPLDENKLSDVIRDLLDPDGAHGQGDVFLVEFLRLIGCSSFYSFGNEVEVWREVVTNRIASSQRRIDLLINICCNNRPIFGVAIENKPWAIDQKDQIADYISHLEKIYQQGHYRLVYLSKDGGRPSADSGGGEGKIESFLVERKLLLMAYAVRVSEIHSLLDWLRTCCQLCQSEKLRWFLRDLGEYVEENFQLAGTEYDLKEE